jgi:hypothetical protein
MFIYLIIQLNLWQRSRENPIYGRAHRRLRLGAQ